MALTLSLESAFIVLSLGGKPFTLTAPETSATLGEPESSTSGGQTTKRHRVKWGYHASYDHAFNLGPLAQATSIIREFSAMLPQPPAPPPGSGTTAAADLLTQWEALAAKLDQLPVLANAAANVRATIEQTSVKITDLVLELDLKTTTSTQNGVTSSTTKGRGAFSLGLAFTPAPAQPVRLFALGITAFGAVIGVKLENLELKSAADGSYSLQFEG